MLVLEMHHRAGEPHGSYQSWWDNGALKEQGQYRAGNRVGIYSWYLENGELQQEHDFGSSA